MLKVLMMGGRRCGKTSALASLFYQAINGEVNAIFTMNDATTNQCRDGEVIEPLGNKRLELQNSITTGGNRTFLVDLAPTRTYWDYTLRLQIPGTGRDMQILFRDVNGEFFDPMLDSGYKEEIENYVKECDVFVVVVDTPYLMAGNDVEKEAANIKDNIHTFLTNINRDKAIQVIFVPMKCEKWVKEGRIDEVTDAVEQLYAATLRDLLATEKIEVSIIPIETAGDILFEELRKPCLLYNENTGKTRKCSKVEGNDSVVILGDGKPHNLEVGEIVQDEDLEAVFPNTSIVRPTSWYKLRHNPNAQYTPHNCEQLVTHILRFMFNKTRAEARGGILGEFFRRIFGRITREDMENAMNRLAAAKLVKNNGDGIKILKSCFLNI